LLKHKRKVADAYFVLTVYIEFNSRFCGRLAADYVMVLLVGLGLVFERLYRMVKLSSKLSYGSYNTTKELRVYI